MGTERNRNLAEERLKQFDADSMTAEQLRTTLQSSYQDMLDGNVHDIKVLRRRVESLAQCPICGAQPWIYEDVQDLHVYCTEDCPAPRFPHDHPRDVSVSWNDWVRWHKEAMSDSTEWLRKAHIKFQMGDTWETVGITELLNRYKVLRTNDPLTAEDLEAMVDKPVWIIKDGVGRWDIVDAVREDLITREGERFPLESIGKTWTAYKKEV